jgi:hypothetical protein
MFLQTLPMIKIKSLLILLCLSQLPLTAQIQLSSGLLPADLSGIINTSDVPDFKIPALNLPNLTMVNPDETQPFVKDPDFWLSTTVNLMGTGLFISRVHNPEAAEWFGYGTQLMGIPALALGISDLSKGQADFSTYANLGYAAWAIYAVTVDHILDVNYRDPVKPGIIVPYVVTYYLAVGSMSAGQVENGWVPWVISGVACLINVGASFYARSKGAD